MKICLSTLILFSLSSCNILDDGTNLSPTTDVKSDIIVFDGILQTSSTDWYLSSSLQRASFDKSKYQNIDSIIFQAGLRTPTADVTCSAELFNISENTSISGTKLDSRVNYALNQINSTDISYVIPSGQILLGVRLKSSKAGVTVYSGDASYLKVYYH